MDAATHLILLVSLCTCIAGYGVRYEAPTNDMGFSYQLSASPVVVPGAQVYSFDGFDNNKTVVDALRSQGLFAACYFSAGTWENWRPDAGDFNKSLIGKALPDWAGEWYLDISNPDLRPLMVKRIEMCQEKGFQAIDPDNVDGWTNDSGFNLTADDQVSYNRFLAEEAHKHNMSVALKNDPGQIPQLVEYFDWAISEECFDYDYCDSYAPFVAAAKPVYVVEYSPTPAQLKKDLCPKAAALGLHLQLETLDLTSYRVPCVYNGTGHAQLNVTNGTTIVINPPSPPPPSPSPSPPTDSNWLIVPTLTQIVAHKRLSPT